MNHFINAVIKRSPELVKQLGRGKKVYSAGSAPLRIQPPYITWQIISDTPKNTFAEVAKASSARVQFDIYSNDESQVFRLSNLLEEAIGIKGIIRLRSGPTKEQITKRFRRTIDVSFFINRNEL